MHQFERTTEFQIKQISSFLVFKWTEKKSLNVKICPCQESVEIIWRKECVLAETVENNLKRLKK